MTTSLRRIFNRVSYQVKQAVNDREETAVNRRNIISSNISSGIAGNLIGGNFLTGFLLLLNADDAFMGALTMVGFAGNLLQIFSPLLMERFNERKRLLIIARCVIHFFNIIVISLIPFLGYENSVKLVMIMVISLILNIVNAVTAPGFSIWHIKSIPENKRAGFFSAQSALNGMVIYVLILAASKAADTMKASGNEMKGLLILRAVAIVFSIADIYFLLKIKEYPNPRSESPVNLISVLVSPFKEKRYLVTVAIACLWNLSANLPGPYYNVYLLKNLKVDYSYLYLIAMFNVPILLFLTPVWTRIMQRISWFKGLYISMGIFLIHYIGLCFVTEKAMFLYPVFAVFSFIIAPGINISMASIPYVNIPEKNQTNYIGFYSTMNNLAALVSVAIGKEFIKRTEGVKLNLLGVSLQNKQYILLLTAVVMVVAVVLIYILQNKIKNFLTCNFLHLQVQ
jgi:Na+/melibiose symporter-like transporter